MRKSSTKGALYTSFIALMLCLTMLLGTTFAWFTDEVTSTNNIIKSGSLDIELEYSKNMIDWNVVVPTTNVFNQNALWEPGYSEVVYFRVTNKGDLALKYQLAVNVAAEKEGTNKAEESFKLSDHIEYGVIETETAYTNRAAAVSAVAAPVALNKEYKQIYKMEQKGDVDTFALVAYMPEEVGNVANHKPGDANKPEITLGIGVYATQLTYESDSFDNMYDDIVSVSDAAELANAIAEGKSVILIDDIALDVNGKAITVASDADVLVNLNGYDITATTTTSGASQILFEVKGELTFEGEGAVALYDNSGAAFNDAYENAAVYVNGGVANLNDGTFICDSASGAMAYAADAVGGDSVINVNGATLCSSYIGIRSFPTVSGKTNTINYNSGVVYGAKNGYDIWTQQGNGTSVVNIADGIVYTREDQWGGMYYVEDGKTLVSNATSLKNALANGENVVLATDVELDENTTIVVASGTETTLDLNGKTLSAENSNTATHNFMIDVKGGTLNLANGTVAMNHTGTNMGWNGATTVIDVTAGGVLNLDGVTVENMGGTDMNFAVHLNNWGEATLNADNCVFKAPYCSVRVFNSGPDMNNVKITNSTMTGGTRAFWVHNYASSDMGGKAYSGSSAAYDEAVVKARLNIDIYNNNNTFEITGTAKSPIRYGFNSAIYYDANGNLVP